MKETTSKGKSTKWKERNTNIKAINNWYMALPDGRNGHQPWDNGWNFCLKRNISFFLGCVILWIIKSLKNGMDLRRQRTVLSTRNVRSLQNCSYLNVGFLCVNGDSLHLVGEKRFYLENLVSLCLQLRRSIGLWCVYFRRTSKLHYDGQKVRMENLLAEQFWNRIELFNF